MATEVKEKPKVRLSAIDSDKSKMPPEEFSELDGRVFSDGGAILFHGDSIRLMQAMPEESIDMIFADPPYGLSNGGTTCHAGRRVSVDKGKWDKSRGIDGDFAFHSEWIEACRRVLKPNGTIWISGTYHSIYACGYALQSGGWHILNDICWYKPNAAPHLACRMFAASHETLIWARKTKAAKHTFHYDEMKQDSGSWDFMKKANRQMRSVWGSEGEDEPVSAWAFSTPSASEKSYGKHPTQKPLKLLERVVRSSTNEGDVVLDPFCGSATTGVAALLHGRNFIGIDADESYLTDMAIPRLNDAINEITKTEKLF